MNEVDLYIRQNIQQYADKYDLDETDRERVLKNASLKTIGRNRTTGALKHLISVFTALRREPPGHPRISGSKNRIYPI